MSVRQVRCRSVWVDTAGMSEGGSSGGMSSYVMCAIVALWRLPPPAPSTGPSPTAGRSQGHDRGSGGHLPGDGVAAGLAETELHGGHGAALGNGEDGVPLDLLTRS